MSIFCDHNEWAQNVHLYMRYTHGWVQRVPDSSEMVALSKNNVMDVKWRMFPRVGRMFPNKFPGILTSSYDVIGVNMRGIFNCYRVNYANTHVPKQYLCVDSVAEMARSLRKGEGRGKPGHHRRAPRDNCMPHSNPQTWHARGGCCRTAASPCSNCSGCSK